MPRTLWLLCTLAACAAQESREEEHAITNGAADSADPAVVALVEDSGTIACTATAIGPHTAITAAHCFVNRTPRSLSVVFGPTVAQPTATSAVSDARSHPSFDPASLANDVALLTFRDKAPAAIALDTRTIDSSLVGTDVRVVGFGVTSNAGGDAGTKREGTARISAVQADEITATPNPSQPCCGDSGGPALLGPDAIAAVVSRGDAACADHAVLARIDVARSALVDPYLADTAPGTAHVGDACFYDGHCGEGSCLPARDDPSLFVCSEPPVDDCGGCSTRSSASLWLASLWLIRRRSRGGRRVTTASRGTSRAARSS